MSKIKKSKLKPAYTKRWDRMRPSASFPKRNKAGVYIIYKSHKAVYVGFSRTDVYKALYRHFQKWNDPRQVRVTYSGSNEHIKVRVIYCNTSINADRLEKALIIKLKPVDNPQKYWLTNVLDEKEKEMYNDYLLEDVQKVFVHEIDNPF